MSERRSVLLLCDDSRGHAANVLQHIAALRDDSRHDVRIFNPVDRPEASAVLDLREFDVVAIHYTLIVTLNRYLPQALVDKIAAFRGLKIQFIQDEYRWVDAITSRTRELGIDVLFTCVPPDAVDAVYGPRLPGVTTVTTLPGYVPEALVGRNVPSVSERTLDVGYRARDLPFWLGRLGREKVEIGRRFLEHAKEFDLRCDISSSEGDRIYGEEWNRFLGSSRATLGTESGASIVDFDGMVQRRVEDYLVRKPEASYDEVEQAILAPHEGNARIATASPRLFEAAALRTALVLYPGGYSGVVEPWTHYLPLEKDFSNFDTVAEKLCDDGCLTAMTKRAYTDLIASGRYTLKTFVEEVDEVILTQGRAQARLGKARYRLALARRKVPSLRRPSKVRVAGGKLARPWVRSWLVARDSAVRQLARENGGSGALEDLWRLAALRRVVRRRVVAVTPSLESDGRRLFLSTRLADAPFSPNGAIAPGVHAALASGALEEIVWNNSAAGQTVPLIGRRTLPVPIGHHGIEGAHSFRALVALSRQAPELVFAAIEPLLRRP